MLSKENIEALLKIDTQNSTDNRYIRIMSCDNPVKELFVYHLQEVNQEFDVPNGTLYPFEIEIALCILKYDKDLHAYLNGDLTVEYGNKCPTIVLSQQMIERAIDEIFDFYTLVSEVATGNGTLSHEHLDLILTYKIPNYIAILQLCGIVDLSEGLSRSKFLDRFLNIKDQVANYRDNRMKKETFLKEFREHLDYLSKQKKIIEEYNMKEEDFLVYSILFDIRHYKPNRGNKVLKRNRPR